MAESILNKYPDLAKLDLEDKNQLIKELRATLVPTRKFILGVDLDGVVTDFYGGLKRITARWMDKPESALSNDFGFGLKAWGLEERSGGYDLSYDNLHKHAINQHELFANAEPIAGAPYQLRRLSRLGVHIRIITHRLYLGGLHETTVTQTAQWLEKHDVPYLDLCFVKDKVSINADLYIDDSPSNIEAYDKVDKPCIVFENSTNKHINAPLRAKTWEEVYNLVVQAMNNPIPPAKKAKGAPEKGTTKTVPASPPPASSPRRPSKTSAPPSPRSKKSKPI